MPLRVPLLALLLTGALAVGACDTADPIEMPDPDSDPEPEPEPITLDGYYVGPWHDGGTDFEWRIGLEDDEGTLSRGEEACSLHYHAGSTMGSAICRDVEGSWSDGAVTFHATFATGETISFVGTVTADGDRLPGTVSGSYQGDSFAAGVLFERQ